MDKILNKIWMIINIIIPIDRFKPLVYVMLRKERV